MLPHTCSCRKASSPRGPGIRHFVQVRANQHEVHKPDRLHQSASLPTNRVQKQRGSPERANPERIKRPVDILCAVTLTLRVLKMASPARRGRNRGTVGTSPRMSRNGTAKDYSGVDGQTCIHAHAYGASLWPAQQRITPEFAQCAWVLAKGKAMGHEHLQPLCLQPKFSQSGVMNTTPFSLDHQRSQLECVSRHLANKAEAGNLYLLLRCLNWV